MTIRNEYDILLSGDCMEQRNSKLIIGMAGGTASASAKTYKISLPNNWVERLAVTEEDRELTLSFDGEKIIIEKKKTLKQFIDNKLAQGHEIKKLSVYDRNLLCTVIAADFTDETLAFENYTDSAIKLAFGKNKNPDWRDFQDFLRERCVPESRSGIRYYLAELGLEDYEPIKIIEKTEGRMAEDNMWIKVESVKE